MPVSAYVFVENSDNARKSPEVGGCLISIEKTIFPDLSNTNRTLQIKSTVLLYIETAN